MDNLSSLCLLCLFARARPCTNVNGLPLPWGKKISSLCPFEPGGASATVFAVAFRAAHPLLLQLFFVLTVISAYVYPLSYIGLGRLAMNRSPWLASIGIACGFVGCVIWSLFAGETFCFTRSTMYSFDTHLQ